MHRLTAALATILCRPVGMALIGVLASTEATAHDDAHRRQRQRADHELAREALKSGEVRPLEQVIAEVKRATPGEIVGIELETRNGRWVYQIKLITPDGALRRLSIDARRPPGANANDGTAGSGPVKEQRPAATTAPVPLPTRPTAPGDR